MKKISKTIQVDAYTDDDGVPVCGECKFRLVRGLDKWCALECDISGGPDADCPIWIKQADHSVCVAAVLPTCKQDDTGAEDDQP